MINVKINKVVYNYYNDIVKAYNYYVDGNLTMEEVIQKALYNMCELMIQRHNIKNKVHIDMKGLVNEKMAMYSNMEVMLKGFKNINYSLTTNITINDLNKNYVVILNRIKEYYNLDDVYTQVINYALFTFKIHFYHYIKRASIDAFLNIYHVMDYLKTYDIIDSDYLVLLDNEEKAILKCKLKQSVNENLTISITREENTGLKNIFMSSYSPQFISQFNIDLYKFMATKYDKNYIQVVDDLFDVIFSKKFKEQIDLDYTEIQITTKLEREYDIQYGDNEYILNHRITVHKRDSKIGNSKHNNKTSGGINNNEVIDLYNEFKQVGNSVGYKHFTKEFLNKNDVYVCMNTDRPDYYKRVFYFIKDTDGQVVGCSVRNINDYKEASKEFEFECNNHKFNLYNISYDLGEKINRYELIDNLIKNNCYYGYYLNQLKNEDIDFFDNIPNNLIFDTNKIKSQLYTTKINSKFQRGQYLYNISNCKNVDTIYIVEGVKDALSVIKNGGQAIALLTAQKLTERQLEIFKENISTNTEIRLGLDWDTQGILSNIKLHKQLTQEGYTNIKIVKYLKNKDFGDMDIIDFNNDICTMDLGLYLTKVKYEKNIILKDSNEQKIKEFENVLKETEESIESGNFKVKITWDITKINKYLAFFLNKQNI